MESVIDSIQQTSIYILDLTSIVIFEIVGKVNNLLDEFQTSYDIRHKSHFYVMIMNEANDCQLWLINLY